MSRCPLSRPPQTGEQALGAGDERCGTDLVNGAQQNVEKATGVDSDGLVVSQRVSDYSCRPVCGVGIIAN